MAAVSPPQAHSPRAKFSLSCWGQAAHTRAQAKPRTCVFQDQPECSRNRRMMRGGLRDSRGQPRASRMPSRVDSVWKAGERRGQT